MLAELARAVRTRGISAAELVREALARIDRLDGPLNSVIRLRPDALDEAAALDVRLLRGGDAASNYLPLAGLPFLVKDVEDVEGLPTTYGSLLFAHAPAARSDSGTVARLRAAGAIPIGKTNVSEFAFEGVTDNRLFGATRNPWNTNWSPGGSSGGSAAALAAGLVPIATGTDAGGSVRGPAALCGLIGLKPTNGLISRAHAPEWLDLVTDGIFGTTAVDVASLLAVVAGPWPGDPTAVPSRLGSAAAWSAAPSDARDLPRRVLAAPRLQPGPDLPPELEVLFAAALRRLEADLGLPVEDVAPEAIFPGPHHPDDDSLILLGAETVAWLGRGHVMAGRNLFDRHFVPYVDDALAVDIDAYLAARRRCFDHTRRMDQLLGADDVLVTPTLNVVGLLADGTVPGAAPGLVNALANTNPQNLTGHPAISVPAGVLPSGIPFGLQITAPRYREDLLLRLASAWEQINPWPRIAPGYAPFDGRAGRTPWTDSVAPGYQILHQALRTEGRPDA